MSRPPVKKKVFVEEKRSKEEIALASAMTSQFSILIPLYEAKHIYIKNPLTSKTHHLSTSSEAFYEMFIELCGKGLKDKLRGEVSSFAESIDSRWAEILNNIDERLVATSQQ
jgi:hypothetical protein